ncbi:DUF5693 family protein [Paenibacillus turpanensis]|uniref:DUF5693 family protein n=1 Tax=Paenibacillus turpanensis TaxID=2689078 RepID=UPI001FB7FFE4|nr:DUF5693 family protein [Paenibacillus turpanensis]
MINALNRKSGLVLRLLVLLGILASIPFVFVRHQAEQTGKTVSIVFDYRDVMEIASYKPDPEAFLNNQLDKMQQAGVNALAIYESSLAELDMNRRIKVFSATEAAVMTGYAVSPSETAAYVLFTDTEHADLYRKLITDTFTGLHQVRAEPWSFKEVSGLKLHISKDEAMMYALDPDPVLMEQVKSRGFEIIARLSDQRQPYPTKHMESLFGRLQAAGVKWILFEGQAVTGFADQGTKRSLNAVAELLKRYGIGIVAIEQLDQKGFNQLAFQTDYQVIRLHSLSDRESAIAPETMSDRFLLAATDRNIRMIFLNTKIARDTSSAKYIDTLDNIYKGLSGPAGAVSKLQKAGFTLGLPEPFTIERYSWQTPLKGLLVVGAVALIALMVGAFIPQLIAAAFVFGMVGSAGLYVISEKLLSQGLALGASISAPTLALVWAFRKLREWQSQGTAATMGSRIGFSLRTFWTALAISASGIFYIIGLLNHATYYYVIEQFRGVSALHLIPIALTAIYALLYTGLLHSEQGASEAGATKDRHAKQGVHSALSGVKRVLNTNITVLWVVLAGLFGVVIMYYLSRTGNDAQVSPYERAFRALLENTFGVRPRTKEFLLAHPLFIFGVYLAARYRIGLLLLIGGVIGQLSIVDTFAHLHTPLLISLIRVVLGAALGTVIGLIAIMVWEIASRILVRGWKLWNEAPRKS